MSARRQSWAPYEPITTAELDRARFGEQRVRDLGDITAAPAISGGEWVKALAGLALTVGVFTAVVILWLLMVPTIQRWAQGGF